MRDVRWTSVATPLGPFVMVGNEEALIASSFAPDVDGYLERMEREIGTGLPKDDTGLIEPAKEVERYFAHESRRFVTKIDLVLVGGAFAKRALDSAKRIPYATMATYGEIAAMAGSPRAARAAGTALRNCPFELFVPCHRIVPAGPGFGTYGGHPERREFLLRFEGAI